MSLSKKTSIQIAQQLPEFIRDDSNYQNFVLFLEAYYEWLETQYAANANSTIVSTTSQGVTYGSKNILNYINIDETLDDFVQYFINDFLPYVPAEISTDKRKLLKISKQFYQSKGTEKSYKFLFRTLYNTNVELFNTNDVILRASDGKWIVPKSLRIDSTDHTEEMHTHWLNSIGFKVFGETSKAYAVIDFVKITDVTTEVYISNIQRQFEAGETITVVDNNNKEVYFYDGEAYVQNQGYEIPMMAMTLSDKITGTVSSITINPNFKGLFYNSGDPVVAHGGLNPNKNNPVGLSAEIGDTTSGTLSSLVVVNPSHGYTVFPNTTMTITGGGGTGAAAQVSLIDETNFANITLATSNTLGAVANVLLGNTTHPATYTFGGAGVVAPGNTNTTLANTLTFKTYAVAPIGSVQITNPGTNYTGAPTISAQSNYTTDYGTDDFRFLGILQPIQIVNGGINYGNSNTITIIGGTGFGAYANITVNSAGSIISANYIYQDANTITYPLGGLGYDPNYLPTVNVSSLSGSNASLIIPGVMAVGATFSPTTDSIGSIQTIDIINGGEDYISTPNLSLRVADVAVKNVSTLYSLSPGDLIYQGTSLIQSYSAYVDTNLKLSTAVPANTANDIYQIRTYDYVGSYNSNLPLKIDKIISPDEIYTLVMFPTNSYTDQFGNPTSIKRYGDGTARATAAFSGGLIVGQGRYLNDDGWLSSLGRVLESENYNKYTYILSTPQALAKYKELVLNLLHPSGMRLLGRNQIMAANSFNMTTEDELQIGYPLSYVAGSAAYATLSKKTSWFTGKSFSVGAQETSPTGLFFKPDGTKMYIVGSTGDDVNEYNLSTPWDIATSSFLRVSASLAVQENAPTDIFFKPDGTQMYLTGTSNDSIYQYTLSSAWNVATLALSTSFSVAAQETNPNGIWFKPDGTKMYVIGTTGDDVNEYNLSTPWNANTASFVQVKTVADTAPTGLCFNSSGSKMYVCGSTSDTVLQYNLSTPWDISTATLYNNFSVASEEVTPQGVFIEEGNNIIYVVGSTGDRVYEYKIPFGVAGEISNNVIKLTNVISGNIGNTIFANDIIEFTATNNVRAYSTITRVDWSNNQIFMRDNVFLTFASVAFASINATSNIINITTLTGQYDGKFKELTPANSIFFVGDTISLNNGGTFYTITNRFANGNFSINNSTLGPIANTLITVNKNANTQSVMIYGDVDLYDTPQLTTESGESLITEAGAFILIG